MGYLSDIGIAIISRDKETLEKAQSIFVKSDAYKRYCSEYSIDLLSLFQKKQYTTFHLLIATEGGLKWYGEIDNAWRAFSEICNDLRLNWCFIRTGEEYGDIEEYDNLNRFEKDSILLEPADIFGISTDIRFIL